MGDAHRSGSPVAVAEHQGRTSPRMRVRHFDIAGVAWSNFKPGIYTNVRKAIFNCISSIDIVNVSCSINIAIVALKEGSKGGGRGGGVR
jgi:hypothetical protein